MSAALEAAGVTIARLNDDLTVVSVTGPPRGLTPGGFAPDAVPALVGLEEVLAAPDADLSLPFVAEEGGEALAVGVRRRDGALWLVLRDASAEAAVQQRLVQQHNALALAQRELAAARDAALAADRAKTAFLANVSHELRTPLNVILGGASILLKDRARPLPEDEWRGFVRDIHDGGALLLNLVNDLIDLSRAESGNLALHEEWCAVAPLADEIAHMVRALPDAQELSVERADDGAVPEVWADPTRLRQILLNLCSNAVRACGAGARVVLRTGRDEMGRLALEVADDGPGMTERELDVALRPFGQPKPGRGGAGLGLAIVARLAELHGGSLAVDTAPGEGLRARVRLPAARFEGPSAV